MLDQLLQQLQKATKPADVFGPLPIGDEATLRRRYHELVHVAHPDHNGGVREATEAFRLLQHWYERAQRNTARGSEPDVTLTITTKHATYTAVASTLEGDVCDLYEANDPDGEILLKIVREPRDNDLMQAEARALGRLKRELAGKAVGAHFPTLVDAFAMKDEVGATRQVNVLQRERRYVTLAKVVQAFPNGVEPADTGWMFNRLLAALGTTHNEGLVHGAPVLDHILVRPSDHNGMLIDWCYSAEAGNAIKAISPAYHEDYPPEVLVRQPASPSTDLFIATRSLVRLLGGNGDANSLPSHVPRAMHALIRACLIPAPHRRPQNAWQVFDDWREILQRLYGPPTFRPLHMPQPATQGR